MVGFAGVRVVDFWLDGKSKGDMENFRVVLQPAIVVDDSAVAGGGLSRSVYQPVILVR